MIRRHDSFSETIEPMKTVFPDCTTRFHTHLRFVIWALPFFGFTAVAGEEHERLQKEIAEVIEQMLNAREPIPLPLIIRSMTGFELLDWEDEESSALERAARRALLMINEEGVRANRVNEVGNRVETFVQEALQSAGFATGVPKTISGKKKTAGYPDLTASRGGARFFVEVKTYNPENVDTTHRSFYLSPSREFKVTHDAYHLLIAFAMEGDESGAYRARSVKWLDLFELRCRLKYEFNASNRDLYSQGAGLIFFSK